MGVVVVTVAAVLPLPAPATVAANEFALLPLFFKLAALEAAIELLPAKHGKSF